MHHMRRRQFISLLVASVTMPWPRVAAAQGANERSRMAQTQPVANTHRIGILLPGPLGPRVHQWDAFRSALGELGRPEGTSITLIFRAPPQEGDPIENLAAELVRSNVDLIVAVADRAIQTARHATNTIPIVMCPATDAVEQGFIISLAHPGGNITGISILNAELAPKRLEILREIVPKASRIAVLTWSGTAEVSFRAAETAARSIGVELLSLEVSEYADLDRAFQTAAKGRADALLVLGGPPLFGLRKRITQLALKHNLPALYYLPSFAREGGLLVYGPSDTDYYRRAAWYVDKILKGAKPNDLPVEQPTRFELILNLKTAKSLGITIPTSIMVRANEVIE
jgi:putative tryptophan/tyrosine transport system substrate-binding protein